MKPGDVFFVNSKGKMGGLIKFFTRTIGEGPTRVTHCGIVVSEPDSIVEAVPPRVRRAILPVGAAIFRPKGLSDNEITLVVAKAESYVGRTYGFAKLAAHAADWLLFGAYCFRRLTRSGGHPICSFVVAGAYSAVGKRFGQDRGAVSPDDIWDYMKRNPSQWECIQEF